MGRAGRGVSRRQFLHVGIAGLAGGLLPKGRPVNGVPVSAATGPLSHIYHARNGTPRQNVSKVFETAYGGIHNFIGYDDIVLLRPNLQWPRNGYTNSEIGLALIDLILTRPGGFAGEVIVIENTHQPNPHIDGDRSGWCTTDKLSNGPYNWFEIIQYFVENAINYPEGVHTDPVTGQINVTFQFVMPDGAFALQSPHPILSTYGGQSYSGAEEHLDGGGTDPFPLFKQNHPEATCMYVQRTDVAYSSDIARVSPLRTEYAMSYPVIKSQHSGLYVSLYQGHPTAWHAESEAFTSQTVKLINMTTLNHHGLYAGVTSVVKGHFGMVYPNFHNTGWYDGSPRTFHYAGGAIGYWMATIRRADLHISCAERIGTTGRLETDAFSARSVAISSDPIALDYYAGKHILYPAGGPFGAGGSEAQAPDSNDPSLVDGYYGLTLEFCRDPLADHSIINGTLREDEMAVHLYDFVNVPGDLDHNGNVDHADYQAFQACANGPGGQPSGPSCAAADLDGDGDIDLSDLGRFWENFTGPS